MATLPDRPSRGIVLIVALLAVGGASRVRADGLVLPPRDYQGSLEERAQEAILIFHPGDATRPATEDLILKVKVEGSADKFAWVIPLPNEPRTGREDARLFEELHRYVQARLSARAAKARVAVGAAKSAAPAAAEALVEVLSRKVVGSFDVAVVRERQAGALNGWLRDNGYRAVEDDDLVAWYRKKGYVFACIKVADAALAKGSSVELHPLRFSFETGGRDGIYFPMRLTGLQRERFDVNLYVFYNKWVNDRVSRFGYIHRGFERVWRDYDSPECPPNAGKSWSDPAADPYLRGFAGLFPTVTALVRKLHPGERYYLTNIQARGLAPRDVRDWPDDLWLFPYYTDRRMVPFDARPGGPAAAAYPHADQDGPQAAATPAWPPTRTRMIPLLVIFGEVIVSLILLLPLIGYVRRRGRPRKKSPDRFDEIP